MPLNVCTEVLDEPICKVELALKQTFSTVSTVLPAA